MHRLLSFCVLFIVIMSASVSIASAKSSGFVPELIRTEISATEVAPGKTLDMTQYWRNAGGNPAISYMLVGVFFRCGDVGFFNADGGAWFGGGGDQPFATYYYPTVPTTMWTGDNIYETHVSATVPADSPDGVYDVLVAMYDRGARIGFGPANAAMKSPIENFTSYKIGSVKVSKAAASAAPAVWNFGKFNTGKVSLASSAAISQASSGRSAGAIPEWVKEPVMVGNHQLGVTLDKKRNYALAAVWVNGTVFESGGRFPSVGIYDSVCSRSQMFPDDPQWKVQAVRVQDGLQVTYKRDGFAVLVCYKLRQGMIEVTVKPTKEDKYKALMLTGGGSLISIPSDKKDAVSSGFVLSPSGGGALVSFNDNDRPAVAEFVQSWVYPASFVSLAYNGTGLIVRSPQYGGAWSYGTAKVNGISSLLSDVAMSYRPGSHSFNMSRPEDHITLQLVPVKDTNKDGVFNWVDIGVAYRQRFIKTHDNMDIKLRDSIVGKVDVDSQFKGAQNYDELIKQIRSIDFAPHTFWLVGAHTPSIGNYCEPPWDKLPNPSHNGPDGYDYFAFKNDAEKAGARVGIHEMFQCSSAQTPDWGKATLQMDEFGKPKATWGGFHNGKQWCAYNKALNVGMRDGSFVQALDEHFKQWNVRPGDTWHWDCMTAMCGQRDFSTSHPATNGTDFRDCISLLKYVKSKGIHITSEGLQEGTQEFCDFSWSAQVNWGKPWGDFDKAESVPLLPVLFQGKAYYGIAREAAWNLVYGGKACYEWTSIDRNAVIEGLFDGNVCWRLVADRTVKNMIKTDNGWRVEYTEGGVLTADLSSKTFTLEIDGKKYDADNLPATSWGVTARKVSGKIELHYPSH